MLHCKVCARKLLIIEALRCMWRTAGEPYPVRLIGGKRAVHRLRWICARCADRGKRNITSDELHDALDADMERRRGLRWL
jgi:hypothetical protein